MVAGGKQEKERGMRDGRESRSGRVPLEIEDLGLSK